MLFDNIYYLKFICLLLYVAKVSFNVNTQKNLMNEMGVSHTHNKGCESVTDTLMIQNRQENRPVVYLDETWANAHDDKDCDWVEKDDVTGRTLDGIKRPPGKGCTAYYSWSWL